MVSDRARTVVVDGRLVPLSGASMALLRELATAIDELDDQPNAPSPVKPKRTVL